MKCSVCGRFMAHRWYQATDESDSWQDYYSCSRDRIHAETEGTP